MTFVWYSVKGYSLALARRVAREGNDVLWYQRDVNRFSPLRLGQGLVKILDHFRVPDGAVVVFDFTDAGQLADDLRRRGVPVIGDSAFADALEHNRLYALRLMRLAGIPVPQTWEFTSAQAGADFARRAARRLVLKVEGEAAPASTIVGEDGEALAARIERLKPRRFVLQEYVEGEELSVEAWFDGSRWVPGSVSVTWEEKRLMTGGLGPNTGCMGNVVKFVDRHPLQKLLFKMQPLLEKAGYVGPLDLNTRGGYGLEFTPRFGYDALVTAVELYEVELGKWLSDLARGQASPLRRRDEWAIGVTMSVPPFPVDDPRLIAKSAGALVEVPDEEHFAEGDVALDEDGQLVTAGNDGVVGVMTAVAADLATAKRLVYERAKRAKIQDVQYRLDIGDRVGGA